MRRRAVPILCVFLALAAHTAAAGRLESELSRRLRGGWCVVNVEIYSSCAGAYNNNKVQAGGVSSKAQRRFAPGELVKINKINLKRSRLDLFLSLAEPVLMGRMDGPFELFDEHECRVQLMVELPRELVSGGDVELVLDHLDEVIEIGPALAEAQAFPAWNQRRRKAYPPDYELTLARHQVWQAEEINNAVTARSGRARADAIAATNRLRRDKDYLDGFVAGVEAMHSWSEHHCPDLIEARIGSAANTPSGGDRGRGWKEGYEDGQELLFNLLLADRLEGCYVPVPLLPAEN